MEHQTESTHSYNTNSATNRQRQKHETGNTSVEVVCFSEYYWIGLEEKIDTAIYKLKCILKNSNESHNTDEESYVHSCRW